MGMTWMVYMEIELDNEIIMLSNKTTTPVFPLLKKTIPFANA